MTSDPTTKCNAIARSAATAWLVVAGVVSLAAIACGGGSSAMGGERQPCYPNGTCNLGLTCLSQVCVSSGGTAGRGGSGGAAGTGGSAAGTGGGAAGTGGGAAGTGGGAAGRGGGAAGTGGATAGAGGGAAGAGGGGGGPPALGAQIDRMGRAQMSTLLTAPFATAAADKGTKLDMYSVATPSTASSFEAAFESSLAVFDSLDTNCGNQLLAGSAVTPARYMRLGDMLLDDQLYLDTSSGTCTTYLAVETSAVGATPSSDCGGRTPTVDAVDATYSLLIAGVPTGVTDGLTQDDKSQSSTAFPFLASPN